MLIPAANQEEVDSRLEKSEPVAEETADVQPAQLHHQPVAADVPSHHQRQQSQLVHSQPVMVSTDDISCCQPFTLDK